ncbi:MAG: hypothetical protein FWD90_12025 [Defluviitaleaceae bacterium]|nr:hypothetical protein [Defluviitaleaceae bacterium]
MREKQMVKTARKYGYPDEAVCALEQAMEVQDNHKRTALFMERMDALFTEEQRLRLWEVGGSCTGGETGRQVKIMAKELAGMTLTEKIKRLNQNEHIYWVELNKDDTITAYCGCHCLQHRVTKPKTARPPSYYGCAAGAAFQNLKIALGVDMKIKSVDYPQPGSPEKSMTFIIEVLGEEAA